MIQRSKLKTASGQQFPVVLNPRKHFQKVGTLKMGNLSLRISPSLKFTGKFW